MERAFIVLVAAVMVLRCAAQGGTSAVPPAVSKAFVRQFPAGRLKKWVKGKEEYMATFHCKYMDWLILGMKKIETAEKTHYAIHVGQVQSLGPDDADIGSEYVLYFSERGELVVTGVPERG